MSRLTIRAEEDGVKAILYGKRDAFLEGEIGYAEADKLAHYEDLEEQGRLIEQRYATIDECYCTACNQDYTRVAEGEGGALWVGDIPNYCPWCGAKFVSYEELAELERGGME